MISPNTAKPRSLRASGSEHQWLSAFPPWVSDWVGRGVGVCHELYVCVRASWNAFYCVRAVCARVHFAMLVIVEYKKWQ